MSRITMRYFLVILLSCSLGLVLSGNVHASPMLSVYQYTLGAPNGSSPGNPFIPGSATNYLGSLNSALAGSLSNRSTFAPREATVWGPNGRFGGELYFVSLVQGIPQGALLEEHKALFYTLPGKLEQTRFDVTFYFPMEAYQHTASGLADGFTRLHFATDPISDPYSLERSEDDGSLRTFASFASFAGDFSNAGAANNPPPAIANFAGTSVRYEATYSIIEGDWGLVDEAVSARGFTFGTDFVDLDPTTPLTMTPLGSVSATSVVVSEIPEPATLVLLALGICGFIGYRWCSHRQVG